MTSLKEYAHTTAAMITGMPTRTVTGTYNNAWKDQLTSWNGEMMESIFRTEGCVSINGTKAVPCLQADILGDWREEIIMAREDNNALRVFVSDIPTKYSFKTLMHDPVYRAGVAAEPSAYNQPPHIGFCLRESL